MHAFSCDSYRQYAVKIEGFTGGMVQYFSDLGDQNEVENDLTTNSLMGDQDFDIEDELDR